MNGVSRTAKRGKAKVAIIGSGNIGTDLMLKVVSMSSVLEMGAMVGIDPESDGLARARTLGVPTTALGVDGLVEMAEFSDIDLVFDATSAGAHQYNEAVLRSHGKTVVDLTPAALGPHVIPVVNLTTHATASNVNMVTCGGQATIPIVAAISRTVPVHYAEIVASVASLSAGPGTRANIDEFTETTARAIETVGGATKGKAIIILNPAEPPMIMRDTVHVLVDELSPEQQSDVIVAIEKQVSAVAEYVPGYRLKQRVQVSTAGAEMDPLVVDRSKSSAYTRLTVYLEVEGAAHYLPKYAGNLDIMTSAAMRTGEFLVQHRTEVGV